jgi:hypothetical protein
VRDIWAQYRFEVDDDLPIDLISKVLLRLSPGDFRQGGGTVQSQIASHTP